MAAALRRSLSAMGAFATAAFCFGHHPPRPALATAAARHGLHLLRPSSTGGHLPRPPPVVVVVRRSPWQSSFNTGGALPRPLTATASTCPECRPPQPCARPGSGHHQPRPPPTTTAARNGHRLPQPLLATASASHDHGLRRLSSALGGRPQRLRLAAAWSPPAPPWWPCPPWQSIPVQLPRPPPWPPPVLHGCHLV